MRARSPTAKSVAATVRGGPGRVVVTVHRLAHAPDNSPFHHFGFRCAASLDQARALVDED